MSSFGEDLRGAEWGSQNERQRYSIVGLKVARSVASR